jgi:hypothetical protein
MMVRFAILALLGMASFSVSADASVGDMAARARDSAARGGAYETVSVQEFWADALFMKDCVPPGSPPQPAFVIYFEVLPSGRLGSMLFEPDTSVSACIRKHVAGRVFSKPPGGVAYVTKIEMAFER